MYQMHKNSGAFFIGVSRKHIEELKINMLLIIDVAIFIMNITLVTPLKILPWKFLNLI
jgi:hypothetical protein